jgi:signal peptide peptidase SppA
MRAADWVLDRPWAITEESLGVILAIAERTNESPEAVEAKLGRPLDNTREVVVRDGVAIIPVVGPISRYADFFSRISGATDIETLAKDFRTCLDDRSIRAIVLNMDTPGGTVSGVSEFADHVKDARGVKPIVAYVGSQAASAGYWIASAADRIVVDPTAMVGSIGVVMGIRKPADDKPGAARTVQFVSSQSPRKRPDPETEAGRSQMQAMADDTADVFVDTVARNRDVPRDTVLSDFGQGGQVLGAKAVDAGMADAIGSLESVIASLSRGEMPCPPSKPRPKPAPKAVNPPRRAAMSEPIVETMSAAEAAELRKQIATLSQQKADADARADSNAAAAKAAVEQAIGARADGFVTTFCGTANATEFARSIRSAFVLFATDDHNSPIAGSPTARQDAFREAIKAVPRGNPGKEKVGSDPADRLRALASDPAGSDDSDGEEQDTIGATARTVAAQLNGTK